MIKLEDAKIDYSKMSKEEYDKLFHAATVSVNEELGKSFEQL
jgi:hypothetical protein